jgi:hypothetical protein
LKKNFVMSLRSLDFFREYGRQLRTSNMIVSEFMGSVEEYSEVYVRLKNTITS